MLLHNNGSGGTGFAINAPSGKTYILTNDHICVGAKHEDNMLYAISASGVNKRLKILERSLKTDLCLVEAPEGMVGLELAGSTFAGDRVRAVGHPRLMPLSVSNIGEIIYVGEAILTDREKSGSGTTLLSLASCDTDNPKFRLRVYPGKDKILEQYCEIHVPNAYYTNVLVRPGNSGSPLVNFYGNVVGVVSGKDESDWGLAVTLGDVMEFLLNR